MKCPVCINQDLKMTHRHNVEIDYCPNCQGVWLDRGELDKIINITLDMDGIIAPVQDGETKRSTQSSDVIQQDIDERDNARAEWDKKKKKSFLEELFNIFD